MPPPKWMRQMFRSNTVEDYIVTRLHDDDLVLAAVKYAFSTTAKKGDQICVVILKDKPNKMRKARKD